MDLREARFKKRISQWELSKRCGVHQSRISLIENGFTPKKEEVERICEAIEVDPDKIDWPSSRQATIKPQQTA